MAIQDTAAETAAEVNIYKHIISSERIGSLLFAFTGTYWGILLARGFLHQYSIWFNNS